ncbi:hypothetical protein [Actinotalea sp. C106]|uniref:hypothetical protein n=1 Tax=Actinotalea sp. C106 TaxID=2908644 RepID=UPI002028811E|nr:hypothetical protein [Actinotalea sp. C106]
MTDLQRLYGLVVASEFPLHQDRPVPHGTRPDVTVRWGAPRSRTEQAEPVEGVVLLELEWDDVVSYAFYERPDGTVLLRFTGTCEFEVSADLAEVTVHVVEGADPGVAVVLTTGAMLAFQLYRRGRAVLHASAVEVDGRALAFVGPSGGGKSTMATLMCAGGASLVTDDVLCVEPGADRPTVRLGATELRLRKGADTLVELFSAGAPGRRTSADQRQILSLGTEVEDDLPLAAIVVPYPDRRRKHVKVVRQEPREALLDLLSFPRLLGWKDPAVQRGHLAHLAAIVAQVPVYHAHVPWGPPFDPGIAAALRARIPELAPVPASV